MKYNIPVGKLYRLSLSHRLEREQYAHTDQWVYPIQGSFDDEWVQACCFLHAWATDLRKSSLPSSGAQRGNSLSGSATLGDTFHRLSREEMPDRLLEMSGVGGRVCRTEDHSPPLDASYVSGAQGTVWITSPPTIERPISP